jgi:hypothetical protein
MRRTVLSRTSRRRKHRTKRARPVGSVTITSERHPVSSHLVADRVN